MSRTTSQCWHVIDTETGTYWAEPWEDMCSATHEAAETTLRGHLQDFEPEARAAATLKIAAVKRPAPCVTITCDGCASAAEWEDYGVPLHCDEPGEYLRDMDWRVIDGRDLCPDCHGLPAPSGPGPLDQPLPGLEPTR
jgi:hypothetical protein